MEKHGAWLLAVALVAVEVFIGLGTANRGIPWASPWFIAAYVCGAATIWLAIRSAQPGPPSDDALRAEVLRVANRIHSCDPVYVHYGKLEPYSPLGFKVTLGKRMEQIQRRGVKKRWWRRPRRYTDSLHKKFVAVLEELARRGLSESGLTYRVLNRPRPDQCGDVAVTLRHLGEKLPRGSASV